MNTNPKNKNPLIGILKYLEKYGQNISAMELYSVKILGHKKQKMKYSVARLISTKHWAEFVAWIKENYETI